MYLCDNEIPKGAPDPEDVRWLRPSEIINEKIRMGEDEYNDPNLAIGFILGGASSNDVK